MHNFNFVKHNRSGIFLFTVDEQRSPTFHRSAAMSYVAVHYKLIFKLSCNWPQLYSFITSLFRSDIFKFKDG